MCDDGREAYSSRRHSRRSGSDLCTVPRYCTIRGSYCTMYRALAQSRPKLFQNASGAAEREGAMNESVLRSPALRQGTVDGRLRSHETSDNHNGNPIKAILKKSGEMDTLQTTWDELLLGGELSFIPRCCYTPALEIYLGWVGCRRARRRQIGWLHE